MSFFRERNQGANSSDPNVTATHDLKSGVDEFLGLADKGLGAAGLRRASVADGANRDEPAIESSQTQRPGS